jgi:uncharacterized protein YwqG
MQTAFKFLLSGVLAALFLAGIAATRIPGVEISVQEQFPFETEPTIWLRRSQAASGQSWLGGTPSLPPGTEWPRHGKTGMPLHFLAQIDLADIPATPLKPLGPALPRSGLLLFFADLEEEMLWGWNGRGSLTDATRVLYSATWSPPAQAPSDLPEVSHPFGKASGQFSSGFSVFPMKKIEAHVIDSVPGLGVYFQSESENAIHLRIIDSIEHATGEKVPRLKQARDVTLPVAISNYELNNGQKNTDFHIIRHQMFGAAHSVQGSANHMRSEGYASLFQLDSDAGVDRRFIFCDMGVVQFWIKPDDLAHRRFDKAFATTEGG